MQQEAWSSRVGPQNAFWTGAPAQRSGHQRAITSAAAAALSITSVGSIGMPSGGVRTDDAMRGSAAPTLWSMTLGVVGVAHCGPSGHRLWTLAGPIHDGWRLTRSLYVHLEQDSPGWYVAYDLVFDLYGEGASAAEALDVFRLELVHHFNFWERESAVGTPGAAAEFAKISAYLARGGSAIAH